MVASNELSVKLKPGVSSSTLQNYISQFGASIKFRNLYIINKGGKYYFNEETNTYKVIRRRKI